MDTWLVKIPWHATVVLKVKANSENDAKAKAVVEARSCLCFRCENKVELESIDDELDVEASIW